MLSMLVGLLLFEANENTTCGLEKNLLRMP